MYNWQKTTAIIIITVKKENYMLRLINPFYKFAGVLLPALILSFSYRIHVNTGVFVVCMLLMLFSRVSLLRMLKVLIPAGIAAAGLFMTGFLFASDSGATISSGMGQPLSYPVSVTAGLQLATRILAFAGLGMTFSFTTDMREFIYSLEQQLRLPSRFAYGVLAAFHLGPMMPYEYKKTSHAFLARGQRFFPLSPKVLVPFIIKSVRWSESLAIAMESKGFDENGRRTCLHVIRVRWFDYVFVILSVCLTVLGSRV
jgi:energy-coupling factor transporter transmembrane protein EcfT